MRSPRRSPRNERRPRARGHEFPSSRAPAVEGPARGRPDRYDALLVALAQDTYGLAGIVYRADIQSAQLRHPDATRVQQLENRDIAHRRMPSRSRRPPRSQPSASRTSPPGSASRAAASQAVAIATTAPDRKAAGPGRGPRRSSPVQTRHVSPGTSARPPRPPGCRARTVEPAGPRPRHGCSRSRPARRPTRTSRPRTHAACASRPAGWSGDRGRPR